MGERQQDNKGQELVGLKISEIEPIEESYGQPFASEAEIDKYIELPLVSSVKDLYRKNIFTISCSANRKDFYSGYGYIVIDFHRLSSHNKEVALQLGKLSGDGTSILLEIPMNKNSTVEEVKAFAEFTVAKFGQQDLSDPTGI